MGLNKGSRTINVSKNITTAFIRETVTLVLAFFSRKLFIEYIGVEYLGISGLFANILRLLSLADLGLGNAMNVSLYKPIVENDTDKIAALLGFYRKLYRIIAVAVFVIGMGLLPFLQYLVNLDSNIPYIRVYYICYIFHNVASYLYVYKTALLRADQKTYLANKVNIVAQFGTVILQIVSIIFLHSYLAYLLIGIASILACNVALSNIADRQYGFLNKKVALSKSEEKGIFTNVSSMFLYKISWTVMTGTDNVLMSVLFGTIYVGFYSNYHAVTSSLESFIALIFTALTASIGNLVATANDERRFETFQTVQLVSFWTSAFVSVCLFFLMQDFIQLLFGKELMLDDLTVFAMVLNTFFTISMRPVWAFREGTGMFRRIRYIMLCTAALNLILSVVLAKLIGLSGILFATSISKLCTHFWYEPNILFREFFHQKVWRYYGPFLQNVVMILFCGAICGGILSFVKTVSVWNWLLKAAICTVVVNGIYLLRYRKDPAFSDLLFRVKMVLSRKTAS